MILNNWSISVVFDGIFVKLMIFSMYFRKIFRLSWRFDENPDKKYRFWWSIDTRVGSAIQNENVVYFNGTEKVRSEAGTKSTAVYLTRRKFRRIDVQIPGEKTSMSLKDRHCVASNQQFSWASLFYNVFKIRSQQKSKQNSCEMGLAAACERHQLVSL